MEKCCSKKEWYIALSNLYPSHFQRTHEKGDFQTLLVEMCIVRASLKSNLTSALTSVTQLFGASSHNRSVHSPVWARTIPSPDAYRKQPIHVSLSPFPSKKQWKNVFSWGLKKFFFNNLTSFRSFRCHKILHKNMSIRMFLVALFLVGTGRERERECP